MMIGLIYTSLMLCAFALMFILNMAGGTKFQHRVVENEKQITLEPKAGHRYELVGIAGTPGGESEPIDLNIGGKTVFRLYHGWRNLKTYAAYGDVSHALGLLDLLKQKKPEIPRFSSAQDEEMSIVHPTAAVKQSIYFNDLTEVDVVTHTIPGASDGLPRLYIAWVTHSKAITATGIYKFDKPLAPVGMPAIKDLYTFAGFNFRMLGMTFAPWKVGTSEPKLLRMFDGDTFMFDDSRKGIVIRYNPENNALICDITTGHIFLLEDPHVFMDKTQIGLEMECFHDGTNDLAAESMLLGLIGLLEPLA